MPKRAGSNAGVFWFTGHSGAGKTSISQAAAQRLRERGVPCLVLDGDSLRLGLCSDLGYSAPDREENIRRVGEVALLCAAQGLVCVCAFITPFAGMRNRLRQRMGALYHEIHVHCPLEECIRRDVKHLYAQAHEGRLKEFTGLDSPYECPERPDLRLETHLEPLEACVARTVGFILERLDLAHKAPA